MKNFIKISAIILAVVFSQTACEKDNSAPKNRLNDNNVNQTKKTIHSIDKLGSSEYFEGMLPYASKIRHDSIPNDVDARFALMYIEAAANYEKGHLGQEGNLSEVINFTTTINLVEGETTIEVEGDEALDYFKALKSKIDEIYSNSDLYATYGSDAFVYVVDIEYGDANLQTGQGIITATAILKVELESQFPDCTIENDWKALDRLGECDASFQGWDAAIRIETNLNSPSCSNVVPHTYQRYYFNPIIRNKDGFNSSLIWDGNTPGDCITNVAYYRSGAKTEADNMRPTGFPGWSSQYLDVYNYSITKKIDPITSKVAHHLFVTYGAFESHAI